MEILSKRELLIFKTHQLIIRQGINKVSVDEIAASLGISKKTVYSLFPDKRLLIEAAINFGLENIKVRIEEQQKNAENAIHQILLVLSVIKDLPIKSNPSLIDDVKKYFPVLYTKTAKCEDGGLIFNWLKNNIERGKSENLYREEIKSDIIAGYLIISLLQVFNKDFFLARKRKIPYVLEEITDHLLFGLGTCAGYKVMKKYRNPENITPK